MRICKTIPIDKLWRLYQIPVKNFKSLLGADRWLGQIRKTVDWGYKPRSSDRAATEEAKAVKLG